MNQLNTPCIFTAPFRAVPVAVRPYRSVSGHSHNRLSSFRVQIIVPTHSELKDKNTTKGLLTITGVIVLVWHYQYRLSSLIITPLTLAYTARKDFSVPDSNRYNTYYFVRSRH